MSVSKSLMAEICWVLTLLLPGMTKHEILQQNPCISKQKRDEKWKKIIH